MKTTRLTTTLFGSLAAALLCAAFITSAAVAQTPAHVMENLSTAKWGAAPPMLPAGAQIAVLAGDPTKAGPYTVRLKFPANYDIPASRTQPMKTSWSSRARSSRGGGRSWTSKPDRGLAWEDSH